MDELVEWIRLALEGAERMDVEFSSRGRTWILSLKPTGEEN